MSDRLQLVNYDGINLFYKGKWTTLEYDLEKGRMIVEALTPLSDAQVEEWIEKAVFKKNLTNTNNKVWNILKEEDNGN